MHPEYGVFPHSELFVGLKMTIQWPIQRNAHDAVRTH